jgi:hypothetical protein
MRFFLTAIGIQPGFGTPFPARLFFFGDLGGDP